MADNLTAAQRSFNMSRIRSTNTLPEMIVRSLVHRLGFRYSLHRKDLPGKPDLVLTSRRKVIFVHGCFWHMHSCRYGRVVPKTNTDYWQPKRLSTVKRDKAHIRALKKDGWKVFIAWECQAKDPEKLKEKLLVFLNI